jgi:chromosome segregation ATPase
VVYTSGRMSVSLVDILLEKSKNNQEFMNELAKISKKKMAQKGIIDGLKDMVDGFKRLDRKIESTVKLQERQLCKTFVNLINEKKGRIQMVEEKNEELRKTNKEYVQQIQRLEQELRELKESGSGPRMGREEYEALNGSDGEKDFDEPPMIFPSANNKTTGNLEEDEDEDDDDDDILFA